MSIRFVLFFLVVSFSAGVCAQNCTNLGQNPGTAFPVCGSSSFNQSTVAICGVKQLPVPCTGFGTVFLDQNPYWYKFTCFAAGTLGFLITPKNLQDDYDWQLFDVTNHDANDVYTDKTLFVACNWSGKTGITGASPAGSTVINCEGTGFPPFSKMPDLKQGHNYLLLVSHYTISQSGYSLNFQDGTASITDTTPPRLASVKARCDGKRITVKLNKRVKCSSLAAGGSDFMLSGTATGISTVTALGCSTGFDMDSLFLDFDASLPTGNYQVKIKKGSDANTLLDNCDVAIPDGDSLSFSVSPAEPADFDSISPAGCAPGELQLIFSAPLLCSSVAADGSDFSISGTTPVSIKSAEALCGDDLSSTIRLTLSQPIYSQGTYSVTLQKGTDGNTLLNECNIETLQGQTVSFTTKDTVSADFNFNIGYSCKADTAVFIHNGGNGIDQWNWRFNSTDTSALQSPVYIYKTFGPQQVRLSVSNGTCSDTAQAGFDLDNGLKADFTAPLSLCPQDTASFKDSSTGKVLAWSWNFGNGNTSSLKNPPAQLYPLVGSDKDLTIRLAVMNDRNCYDTAYRIIKILYTCFIAVPTAFTPNGDNLNDYLYPVNGFKARNLVFRVYNRLGQLVFKTENSTQKWDGTLHGIRQQTGTYVWILQYINNDTGKPFFLKGTTVLIR